MSSADTSNLVSIHDSITVLPEACAGSILLAASHAGISCGHLAAKAKPRAVILHDAGIGRDEAGVAALPMLESIGMPAAAIDHRSARIGDGADCYARGTLSRVNATAARLGPSVGMPSRIAVERLLASREVCTGWQAMPSGKAEARRLWAEAPAGVPIWLLDSNALVKPEDRDAIVVTGSHGGLLGGRPESAVKTPVFAAAYNDAGVGADDAGISRLPALDARGIAGIAVSAASARIGDALSTLVDGIVSHCNPTARRYGTEAGMSMRECVLRLAEAWRNRCRA